MHKSYNCPACNSKMEVLIDFVKGNIPYYYYECPKCKRKSESSHSVRGAERLCEKFLMDWDKGKDLENMSSENMKEAKIEKEDVIYYAERLLKEEGTEVCENPLSVGCLDAGIWFSITNTKYPFFIDLIALNNPRIALSSKEGAKKRTCEELVSFNLKNAEVAHLKEIIFRKRKYEETSLEKQFVELVSCMKEEPTNS